MQRIDELILIFLGGAAAIYFLASTIALLLRREFERRLAARDSRLYKQYVRTFSELALRELPPLEEETRLAATRNYYRTFLDPLKKELSQLSSRKRAMHRAVILTVISDLVEDVSGEAFDRLVYYAEELGLPGEIMKILNKREWWLRAMAARQLGLIKALDAADALIARLEDRHRVVRHQSAVALLKILGAQALRPVFWSSAALSPWERIEFSVVISEFGSDAVPMLLEALTSKNSSIVLLATELLGSLGFTTALEPLVDVATNHRNISVRKAAVRALGQIGDERAVDPLILLCERGDSAMRVRVLEGLGALGSPAAIPKVLDRLLSGRLEEKLAAAVALGRCGEGGDRELRAQTAADDEMVRQAAQHALEELELGVQDDGRSL